MTSLLIGAEGSSVVTLIAKQGPAILSAITTGSGFVVLPEDCENVRDGDIVEFLPLAQFMN